MQKGPDDEDGWATDEKLEDKFKCGRDGDHLMGIPFECDLCHFRNLNLRDPDPQSPKDSYTLMAIRRASLDSFWSRERSTVGANLSRLVLDYERSTNAYSMQCPLPVLGNKELKDRVGMGLVLMMLEASKREGQYGPNIQYDTVRKTMSWMNNAHQAGQNAADAEVLTNQETNFHIIKAPFASRWRERASLGMKRRMGVYRKQNEPLTMKLLLEILRQAEADWLAAAGRPKERKRIKELACYLIVGFMLSLRGEEVPLVSLQGLIEHWAAGRKPAQGVPPHIMIPLQGKFKGEQNTRWHLVPIAENCASGVPSRKWLARMLQRRVQEKKPSGNYSGPFFAKKNGKRATISDHDPLFKDYLTRLRLSEGEKFFHKGVRIEDYSLRRSLRRGSTGHATNQNIPGPIIDEVNRWRKKESARGGEANVPLRQVYTTVMQTLPARLEYSKRL